jgi:outer membrane receptor for ferrienterochelin and colicin
MMAVLNKCTTNAWFILQPVMKIKIWLTALVLFIFFVTPLAQNRITCFVRDSVTLEKLQGVSVIVGKTKKGGITDSAGKAVINNIPGGDHTISFSIIGFKPKTLSFTFPLSNEEVMVRMEKAEEEKMEEVIVSSSRTESRIENLPTKVEVLGIEEVNEEVGIKPGNIASLLGDIAGIQTQQTSAATGNTEMRVQGLPGKYTQLLKDGVPLFGGYSGSFSILQIPPLDLKQIEIIKGASSTLYGGGAIAGMINLISKKPKEGVFEKTILLNQSTLKESNVNVYLSNRKNKLGYTFFTGLNYQKAVDVNKDGFSDVPDIKGFFIHPVLFMYPDKKNTVSAGYNGVFESRKGGDMLVLKGQKNGQHQYFDLNRSFRNTVDVNWENKINVKDRFNFKATGSWLNRQIETNTFGMKANQLSYFSEASYLKRFEKNDLVAGINLTGEHFTKKLPDSTRLTNYDNTTVGIFVQDDWRLADKFTMQTGLRLDHHNQYGSFILPRLSLLYKINSYFTTRLGGGLGYKIPTVFSADIDEREYPVILPLNYLVSVKAERSAGANWDVNFHQKINGWETTINQTFYITSIKDPVVGSVTTNGLIYFANASRPITTYGFETYIQLQHDELEIYLGYVYTVAKKLYDNTLPYLSLSARNKFASVLAYEFTDHFRAGIEAAFTGKQYLDNGRRTSAYPFIAAMMRYDIGKFSFVLNCENLFDYRQTKKENIISGPLTNPEFAQLWGPIDGRMVNLSMRIRL